MNKISYLINKINKIMNKCVDLATILLIATLILVVTAQIVWRYFLKDPLLWTDEFSRYTFIWLSYLSAAIVFREHNHISIDILYVALPSRAQKIIDKINCFLYLGFFIFVLGVAMKIIPIVMKQITPTLGLQMGYVYLAFPVSAIIMLINLISQEFFGEKNELKGAKN